MKNFIIVSLMGGLGDQINQYIFGRVLSEKLNCELIFDTSYYKKKKQFKIQITKFKIVSSVKFETGLFKFPFRFIQYNRFFISSFFNTFAGNYLFKKKIEYFIYDYWHYPFSKNKYKFKKNCYYFGYWHSLPFFKKELPKIKREFSLKKQSKNLKKIKSKITKSCVAIHIRGGDFLNNSHSAPILNSDYYFKSVNYFIKKIKKPIFYIFTNDKLHSKTLLKNIKKQIIFKYISNFNLRDFEEFELMRHFKNLIIANSTFSWTASYLCRNSNAKIISPKVWDKKYKNYDPKFEKDKKFKMITLKN